MPEREERGAPGDTLAEGILHGERKSLARALTLVESRASAHHEQACALLAALQPHSGGSLRVGVTGVPGAGKSTLIEALGLRLVERGLRVAVLAIDPVSALSGGSIPGDKTRMNELARHPLAFIRPGSSAGGSGGIARRTRESILVCEAAGHDVVFVETVGSGQGEIAVRGMVDFLLLLLLGGAGDGLQGIKKGVLELADAIIIHKADGPRQAAARRACAVIAEALRYLLPRAGWQARALTCSAQSGEGVAELWALIERFREETGASGTFQERRRQQQRDWLRALLDEGLRARFYGDADMWKSLAHLEQVVMAGKLGAPAAARQLLAQHFLSLAPSMAEKGNFPA